MPSTVSTYPGRTELPDRGEPLLVDRPPLLLPQLKSALLRPESLWREIRLVAETGSTNVELAAAARAGAASGTVLIAEAQSAGRGRLDRSWDSPPRAGLTFSLLLRPELPPTCLGWLPLMTGVAVIDALRTVACGESPPLGATLKWPNDVLITGPDSEEPGRKIGGILAEAVAGAVIIGIGLNVTTRTEELPDPDYATSLALAGACIPRLTLLVALLESFEARYHVWSSGTDHSGLYRAYVQRCSTIGRRVRVALPGGAHLEGVATGVDADGRLLLRCGATDERLAAGDVMHLRPATGS